MMEETNITNEPPQSSNKAVKVILALVLIMAAVLLWKSQNDKTVKEDGKKPEQVDPRTIKPANAVSVPDSYVLSDQFKKSYSTTIQTPTGAKQTDYPTESTQFTSNKSKEELISYYHNQLIKDGWTIISETGDKAGADKYIIVAGDYTNNFSMNVFIFPLQTSGNSVILSYRQGISYQKK